MGRRGLRRVLLAAAAVLAALAALPMPGSSAQTASASLNGEGWWSATPGLLEQLPATPLGALPVPVTIPAPDVPEGAVPVAMRAGEPARVGAIGILVEAPRGSKVNRMVLTLKEATDPGAQQGTGAAVRACPITTFLVPEVNGPAASMPEADCGLASAEGQRAEDGTWTFDLTTIAALWVDPTGTVQPNGVRLDPAGEPPATFQVAFTGVEDATLEADIVPGEPGSDPFATGGGALGGGSFGSSFDAGSSGGGFTAPASGVPSTGDGEAAAAPERPAGRTLPVADTSRVGQTFGNWPRSVVLLVVAALLLALAVGLDLGPLGRQRPDLGRRQGGVSRALARRLS